MPEPRVLFPTGCGHPCRFEQRCEHVMTLNLRYFFNVQERRLKDIHLEDIVVIQVRGNDGLNQGEKAMEVKNVGKFMVYFEDGRNVYLVI